jgi:hypothetical protein
MTTEHTNIFTKLRADAAIANPRPASMVNRVHANPLCCLEYRLDVGENKAYLVAYCPGKSLPSQARWPKLKAFEIKQRSVAGRDCVAVSVLPSVPQADIALAEEMLSLVGSNCQPGLEPGEAVEDMLACLARMQSLAKGRGQPLSPEKQVGLFGELHVIANLLIPTQGAEKTIAEWVGPAGAPQDFQAKACAMEIKTTRGNLPQTIKISSARQLQADTVARLFLVRIALDSQPSVGASLTEMVNQIGSALAGNSLVAMNFRDKLAEVGYHEEHAKLYEEPKYQIRSVVFYDVRDGFPRIQEKDLPVGIGELSYEIETSACAGHVVDESEVKKSFA